MPQTRRAFLQCLSAGAAAVAAQPLAAPQMPAVPEPRRLKLLVLGGTAFLGPHIVEAAIARGCTVTLFNRGRTNPQLFPDLEKLHGDRDPRKGEGLMALQGRSWDAVVDTSGFYPRLVRASAELLSPNVRQYVFISTMSVYADTSIVNMDESGPIATIDDPTLETFGDQFQYYGPLKALCEQAAEAAMPGRVTSIRPGLIVGPRDNAPRFTYWPVRVERGGEVLAPGTQDDPVQFIDARDLAEFAVKVIEDGTTGVFNANGPNWPTNMAQLLYGCKAVTGGSTRFTWVDADFLAAQNVNGWTDLPLWVAPRGDEAGLHRMNLDRAIKAGLRSRPLAVTVRDTLDWYHAWPADKPFPWRGGLSAERESQVLSAWHEQHP